MLIIRKPVLFWVILDYFLKYISMLYIAYDNWKSFTVLCWRYLFSIVNDFII